MSGDASAIVLMLEFCDTHGDTEEGVWSTWGHRLLQAGDVIVANNIFTVLLRSYDDLQQEHARRSRIHLGGCRSFSPLVCMLARHQPDQLEPPVHSAPFQLLGALFLPVLALFCLGTFKIRPTLHYKNKRLAEGVARIDSWTVKEVCSLFAVSALC